MHQWFSARYYIMPSLTKVELVTVPLSIKAAELQRSFDDISKDEP